MFTLNQIQEAHSRVKSGADFPKYIQALAALGVDRYTAFVEEGRVQYVDSEGTAIVSKAKYSLIEIATETQSEQFGADLLAHQQGKTDYATFCNDCAKSGIYKWVVSIQDMTCTYYDKDDNEVLQEAIPQAL
jgi:uncharacterized protein YbcV (DUF1398 family)